MAGFIEREITNFLRRFIYSSIFLYLRRNISKYNQWKHFFLSLIFLAILNVIIFFVFAIILPGVVAGSLTVSFILFVIYWVHRINNLKRIGNTRNSKYWNNRQFWYSLNGWQFEEEVADIFEKNGYKTRVTPGSGDGGVDIIMYKDGLKYIVQCKRYNGHKATPQELRALWGVMDDFRANVAIMVATDGITDMGRAFVSNKPNYKVLTLDDIIEMSINPETSEQKIMTQKNNTNMNNNTEESNPVLTLAIIFGCVFVVLLMLYSMGVIH